MLRNEKILIAIPFFSGADFLKQAIDSALAQTDPNFELIILDDSIDPAETLAATKIAETLAAAKIVETLAATKIAETTAARDAAAQTQTRYLRNVKNLGMAQNWNQALDLGREYLGVVLLHADDRLKPNFVANYRRALLKNPNATAFFSRAEIINEQGRRTFSFPDYFKNFLLPKGTEFSLQGEEAIKKLLRGNFIFCPTLCFNLRRLGDARFDPRFKMVLDFDLILRILKSGGELMGLYGEPLYEYRRHAGNATEAMTKAGVRFDEEIALIGQYEPGVGLPKIVQLNLGHLTLTAVLRGKPALAKMYLNRILKSRRKIGTLKPQ